MKIIIKNLLEKLGLRLNFVKNLWYLDSFLLLKKLCISPNPVILDIGACDGSSVQDFKRLFPDSSIYSFEPYSTSFNNLKNISKGYNNVKIFQVALSNYDGLMDFYVNKSKATNSLFKAKLTSSFIDDHSVFEECIKVPAMTLDFFVMENMIEKIDILKLDVQGGELMVFEGAQETLRSKKVKLVYCEIWLIEGYEGQPLYHDVASYLASFGYFSFGIYNMHYRKDGHFLWGDAIFYQP